MIAKTKINRRQADDFGSGRNVTDNDATASASISSQKLLLTFSKPVVLRGLPTLITVNDEAPTLAQQTSPTTVLLTYAAPVAAGQDWVIGNKEPQLRTSTGGFVAAATGTFPA